MIRRQTIITFKVPAAFKVEREERCDGRVLGFGRKNRMSINGLEVVSISRRGHVDPAKMRDLAIARGAVDISDFFVTFHEIRNLKSYEVARFIVNPTGEAKPIKVAVS